MKTRAPEIVEILPMSRSAVDIAGRLAHLPGFFFLDSSRMESGRGKFSFMGVDPYYVLRGNGASMLTKLKKEFYNQGDVFSCELTPLPGGIVGYLSYDFGLHLEGIQRKHRPDREIPELYFGFYDVILTIDHLKKKIIVTSTGLPEKNSNLRRNRARQRLEVFKNYLRNGSWQNLKKQNNSIPKIHLKSNFSRKDYCLAVNKALKYIAQGDIYQANIAQRFELELGKAKYNPWQLYQILRRISPSTYGGYLNANNFQIVSSSPEQFLSLRKNVLQTTPMKGTRPRSIDKYHDDKLRVELQKSLKDKAELLMITDLERNDLGRVCEYGSIKVKRLRSIEKYNTVYQATSTIEGKLMPQNDAFDVLQACFPGGSVTGAPKIRAMEIIEELESESRGIYTGILGYISFSRSMEFNILIRTILAKKKFVSFHVGAGIVADSDPRIEYEETMAKSQALQNSLREAMVWDRSSRWIYLNGNFEKISKNKFETFAPGIFPGSGLFETLLVDQCQIFFLNEHLARLKKGIKYFKLNILLDQVNWEGILKELLWRNRLISGRLRIMVYRWKGKVSLLITVQEYFPPKEDIYRQGFRAEISKYIIKGQRLAYLKSLDYKIFRQSLELAKSRGLEEALLLNDSGELIEGSRTNIFIVKGHQIITPSLASGCLDGVTRRIVIKIANATGFKVRELNLRPELLLSADESFLTNSLIGIMPLTWVNGRKIGTGKIGALTRRLRAVYKSLLTWILPELANREDSLGQSKIHPKGPHDVLQYGKTS